MYYKIIVYKKHYRNIETKKGFKSYVYFEKIKTFHNIHIATLTKECLKVWSKYNDWCYHISNMLETDTDTLIENNNSKVKKYFDMVAI